VGRTLACIARAQVLGRTVARSPDPLVGFGPRHAHSPAANTLVTPLRDTSHAMCKARGAVALARDVWRAVLGDPLEH
jgi:hypothetical protein